MQHINDERLGVLDTTLSARFVPGANLKGKAAGANWLFLLPTLPLERTICLGAPPQTTLASLADFNREVSVLLPAPQSAREAYQNSDLMNVDWCALNEQTLRQWADQSVDLVMAAGWRAAWRLGRERWLQEEIRRLLKPGGMIHYEYYARLDPLRGFGQGGSTSADSACQARLWLTPLAGEVSTVTLLGDQETINFFAERGLFRPALGISSLLKRTARILHGERRPAPQERGDAGDLGAGAARTAKRRGFAPSRVKAAFRRTGVWVMDALDQAGAAVERQGVRSGMLRRAGVLSAGAAAALNQHPPLYLRRLAQEAGINIDGYAWGLVAPADYSSRKLLFFLFDRAHPSDEPASRYIVKMVRNPVFNGRLENERHALSYLGGASIRDHSAVPRVAFAGYHADLALVGESAVEGVPFRGRTNGKADCPYLHQAVEWLTDLGEATASRGTSNAVAADALDALLRRFVQLYKISPEHCAFLTKQIDTIAGSSQRLPTVFQHGDPGLWNLLVTSAGRVAFLDWEAAERAGMPLWDLFYFMRSYSVNAAQAVGERNSLRAFKQQLLADTPLRRMAAGAIRGYCTRIQLPADFIQPLFYLCWMHRATKEASRLAPDQVERGHYVNLLRLCIEQRQTCLAAL